MILTFLGTGAANAYPEAFCRCQNCEQARRLGGPSLRMRSSALLNDDLLIDLGPDIQVASFLHGISLANVRCCLQTHAHADHLDPSHLFSRSREFGVLGAQRLHFFASSATLARLAELLVRDCAPHTLFDHVTQVRLDLELHTAAPLQPFQTGPYRVIPFPADHDPAVEPLLYAVETQGQALFYGTDTASLPEATWQAFHRFRLRFDLVVLDHTYGPEETGLDHLSASLVGEYARRFRAEGLLSPQARILATHISHPGNPVHPELSAYAARHGYEVAWDGLSIAIPPG